MVQILGGSRPGDDVVLSGMSNVDSAYRIHLSDEIRSSKH